MTDNRCVCPRCLHHTCPLPGAEPPFDEVAHEVDSNVICVRIPKKPARYRAENVADEPDGFSFDFNCADADGEKCATGCTKVHVIPDANPPAKKPEEEMLSLKAVRQTMPNDDVNTTLEIEFRAPRNYIPLPEPGPPPAAIVPRQPVRKRGSSKKQTKKK